MSHTKKYLSHTLKFLTNAKQNLIHAPTKGCHPRFPHHPCWQLNFLSNAVSRRSPYAMLGVSWTILHMVFMYVMGVPRALRQHLRGVFLMQCCLEPQRQHYKGFSSEIIFLCRRYYWDNIAQIKTLCSVVHEAPNNIAQVKTLCNVVLEAPVNNAQENVLFNVILKLFG